MQLSQNDPGQSDRFNSVHSLHYRLADGQQIIMLSGIANLNLKAPGWSEESPLANTYCEDLILDLALPSGFMESGQSFKANQAVPYMGLNGVVGAAHIAWAVNSFSIEIDNPIIHSIRLKGQLEVSRSSEVIQCIAYQATLIGSLLG
jgi:hypothetical protein